MKFRFLREQTFQNRRRKSRAPFDRVGDHVVVARRVRIETADIDFDIARSGKRFFEINFIIGNARQIFRSDQTFDFIDRRMHEQCADRIPFVEQILIGQRRAFHFRVTRVKNQIGQVPRIGRADLNCLDKRF